MKSRTLGIAAAGIVLSGLAAYAHGGATGIVEERMEAMESMGKVMKTLTPIMLGDRKYDAETIRKGAAKILSHSGAALTDMFPEGSLQKASEAKPEIWNRWDDFEALAARLEVLAEGLGNAAGNGLMMARGSAPGAGSPMARGGGMMGSGGMMGTGPMMGSQGMMGGTRLPMFDPDQLAKMPADGVFNMVAQTCSACHSQFRVEKR